MQRLAVSGASGKTGWRVVDEALQRGLTVRAIVRPESTLPPALAAAEREQRLEVHRLDLNSGEALLHALKGCTALVIATGATVIDQSRRSSAGGRCWGASSDSGLPGRRSSTGGVGEFPLRRPLAAPTELVRLDSGVETTG